MEFQAAPVAAVLEALLAAGVVDEDAAHGLGGGGEEMSPAVPPRRVGRADQPDVCFVNEAGRLKGLARLFGRELDGGQFPQLVVDERKEVGGGSSVSGGRRVQKLGYGRHHA